MTKKVYEFVEDTEEETTDAANKDEESKPKPSPEKINQQVVQTKTKNSPQKPASKTANKSQSSAKMKQANIMSFFRKK